MSEIIMNNSSHSLQCERYPVNPFDLYSDLICCFSNQIIHMVLHVNDRIDYEILKIAVEQASLIEPITRCHIVRENDSLFWEEVHSFQGTSCIHLLSDPQPEKILHLALSYPLDPYLGRIFQVILIENSQGDGDILVINVHHIAMDGRGLKDFTGLIMTCYTNLLNGLVIQINIDGDQL